MLAKQNTWLSVLIKGFTKLKVIGAPITLGDNQIKRVKVTKSLGLMIDETLIGGGGGGRCGGRRGGGGGGRGSGSSSSIMVYSNHDYMESFEHGLNFIPVN
jgi:hypothetical protein